MVTTVKLRGLNKRLARGKWYVSIRRTGQPLLSGFRGSKADLAARLEEPDILRAYGFHAHRAKPAAYASDSLGALVTWFKAECPAWDKLAAASQADYEKTFTYLTPEFDAPLSSIDQPSLTSVRDRAAKARKTRFADKMVSHLSKLFKEGMRRGKTSHNPAAGMDKLHDADPNANHEWTAGEVAAVIERAPRQLLTPLVLARYQGFRGQSCHALLWSAYVPDPVTGRAFRLRMKKNDDGEAWFPCEPETRAHLDALERTSTSICTNEAGVPWESEKQMQSAVSHYLAGLKAKALIRPGCTLHGLRVTYAASIRRMGLDTGVVADALGDRSERMGKHYTRHVEKEHSRMRAFRAKNVVQNG